MAGSFLDREKLAEAFYALANDADDCADELVGPRASADFRRLADQAEKFGKQCAGSGFGAIGDPWADARRQGEEAMRAAAIRAINGFIMEAPTSQENRAVEAAVRAIQAIRTTELPKLADYQLKLLSRVETTEPKDFSDGDWEVMLGLRDLGLTCMKPHPWKRYIPFFGVYEARPALSEAGHEVLAAAATAGRW